MKTRKIRVKQGFTIVELVIVIGVIGVLSAVLIPTFINLNNKANAAADEATVKNLNTQLRMKEQAEGKNKNMTEALADALEAGYKVENLTPRGGKDIVWDQEKDEFTQFEAVPAQNAYKYWTIAKSASDLNRGYSSYLYFQPTEDLVVNTGFDAGEYSGFNVSYVRTEVDAGRNVIIRTDSAAATLNVNAPSDTVSHFGEAGALSILAVKTTSYHENGKVGFAEINTGRIVLESTSEIEQIHINKKANAESFDEVIIADNGAKKLPSSITRDPVSVAAESSVNVVTVVAANGTSEVVKAYGSSATGSTQKTETQNSAVQSVLGALVLDNGATSDKALDSDEKAEAKDEVASEAVSADFEKQEGADNYIARIGQTGYSTLNDAIDAANASESAVTISLLKDIQQSGSLLVRNSMTLKGGNHVVTTVGTATKGNMAAFDICDTTSITPVSFNIQDMTINSTKHARVFLLNGDYTTYDNPNLMEAKNLTIQTDGEAFYSNGPSNMTVKNCNVRHEGQYLSDKDAVYYSAIIVGYNGTLNIYDSTVSSFGNGAATFPSGGTVNIYNTEIVAFDDFVDVSTGYLFWARHEKSYDTGDYKDWCGSAIINVYSGTFNGPYKVTDDGHTAANRVAEINIFGGVYGVDPTDYVEAGHQAHHNTDGTWTVA